jgi:hypothetical protein
MPKPVSEKVTLAGDLTGKQFPYPLPEAVHEKAWPERDQLCAVNGDFFDCAISEDAALFLAQYCVKIRDWEGK